MPEAGISQAGISNYIPQFTVGCNYLSLPEVPASGTKVFILAWCGISHGRDVTNLLVFENNTACSALQRVNFGMGLMFSYNVMHLSHWAIEVTGKGRLTQWSLCPSLGHLTGMQGSPQTWLSKVWANWYITNKIVFYISMSLCVPCESTQQRIELTSDKL